MIQYIKITNYGGIRDQVELNFEAVNEEGSPAYVVEMPDKVKLLKLMYIYGPNASGKTTVLKAFHFLRGLWLNPAYSRDEQLDFDPFLFRSDGQEVPSEIELAFYSGGIRHIYFVQFTKRSILKEKMVFYQTNQPAELFDRTTDLEKQVSYVQFGSKIKSVAKAMNALETATLHNNSVLGAFQKTNVDIPEIGQLNKWAKNYLPLMIDARTRLSEFTAMRITQDPKFAKWMNTFLNKADRNIREVSVTVEKSGRPGEDTEQILAGRLPDPQQRLMYDIVNYGKISLLHGLKDMQGYSLPFEKESNGTQRYFGLGGVLYILLVNPGFVTVDELDTSLHADLMKHFLQLFLLNSHESQLLFTTHNLNLLEDSDLIREDALWFTEKGSEGEVSLFSAADFDSSKLRKGASLINAYKSGRLGAKPNLGSPYINAE